MPAIRADDSGSEYNDPSDIPNKAWKRSTRRKTSQPYPSPDSESDVSQVHKQSHAEECIISSEAAISSSDSVKLTSVHPPQSKFVEPVTPVTVQGITLRPTVAFDTFWRFAAERQAIDDRRRAGEPAP